MSTWVDNDAETSVKERWLRLLWNTDAASLPAYQRLALNTARIGYVIARDALEGQLTLRAMSLVYTTLLALVPLIALGFSLLKAFGINNVLAPALYRFLAPLGPKGVDLGNKIIGFVSNVKAGVLGAVGLILLIWAVISLLQKVEAGFNAIWHVRRSRPLVERFSEYISLVIVGPLLVVGALSITATISSQSAVQKILAFQPLGELLILAGKVVPYLLVIGAFTFVYAFVPNTRVKLRPALIGGLIAGALWQSAGWAFTLFTASTTRYTAIYSGFAIVIFFIIWLYLSWLILMIGAEITFYAQNPDFVSRFRAHHYLGSRLREKLALMVMLAVGTAFYRHKPPVSLNELTRRTRAPGDTVANLCDQLQREGLLIVTAGRRGYVPARDMTEISLADIVQAVRHYEPDPDTREQRLRANAPVDHLVDAIDQAILDAVGTRTLRDLVTGNNGGTSDG
jgi:membrane protein